MLSFSGHDTYNGNIFYIFTILPFSYYKLFLENRWLCVALKLILIYMFLFLVKGYIGDLCDTDADCTVVSSECRADCLNNTSANTFECSEKRCMCTSGYSFAPTEHTCLASEYILLSFYSHIYNILMSMSVPFSRA